MSRELGELSPVAGGTGFSPRLLTDLPAVSVRRTLLLRLIFSVLRPPCAFGCSRYHGLNGIIAKQNYNRDRFMVI